MTDTHDETTVAPVSPASPVKELKGENDKTKDSDDATVLSTQPAAEMTKSTEGGTGSVSESDITLPVSAKDDTKKAVADSKPEVVEAEAEAETEVTPTPSPVAGKRKSKVKSVAPSTPGSLYSSSSLQLSDMPPPSAQTIEVRRPPSFKYLLQQCLTSDRGW